MKKYLVLSLIALSTSAFADELNVIGFVGLNLNGKLEINNKEYKTKPSYSIGAEIHKLMFENESGKFEFGAGMKADSVITSDDGYKLASTLPIYGSVKYTFDNPNIYIQGKLGYAPAFESDDFKKLSSAEILGGLYTGVGIGAEIDNFILGLSYDVTKLSSEGKLYGVTYSNKFSHSKVSLTAGYKFSH